MIIHSIISNICINLLEYIVCIRIIYLFISTLAMLLCF